MEVLIKDSREVTLKEVTKACNYWNLKGYECWIEALGNGEVKLVMEKRQNG